MKIGRLLGVYAEVGCSALYTLLIRPATCDLRRGRLEIPTEECVSAGVSYFLQSACLVKLTVPS